MAGVETAVTRGIGVENEGSAGKEEAGGADSVCVGGADVGFAGGGGSGALEFEGERVGEEVKS